MSLSVIGKHKITVDTTVLDNGDSLAAYLTSAAGTLLTSTTDGGKERLDVSAAAEKAEDSAHVSGDTGSFVLAVRNDAGTALAADGDYSALQVDSTGALRTSGSFTVDFSFDYAEDSAAASGDIGASVLAVRQDTLATSTSADGDYANFKTNSVGSLYVADNIAAGLLTTGNSNTASILAELQATNFAEDAAHTSGDLGIMSLAVRQDTLANSTSADGDYGSLKLNATGSLYTIDQALNALVTTSNSSLATIVTNTGATATELQNLSFAEDVAHTSGDLGIMALAVRTDTDVALAGTTGDYAPIAVDALGRVKIIQRANVANLQQQVAISTTAAALPATALANRQSLLIQNIGAKSIWVGSATVTASGAAVGIEVPKGGSLMLDAGPANIIYAITTGATHNIAVWELS